MPAIPLPPPPSWVRQKAAPHAAILENNPLELSGAIIALMFERAMTEADVREAEALWLRYKDKVIDYEQRLDCNSYGASGDLAIAVSVVDDISKRHVSLMIAVGNLILNLAVQDKDGTLEALEDAKKEIEKEVAMRYEVEKPIEGLKRIAEPAVRRFKEALLHWLQAYSKRSRKYYVQTIDDIVGIADGIRGLAWIPGKLLVSPSGITPQACGAVRQIEKKRSAAIVRVFGLGVGKPIDHTRSSGGRP